MNLRKIYTDIIPEDIRSLLYDFRQTISDRVDVEWRFSWVGWLSRFRMRSLRNKHVGQRCFIIGNGPSLRKTDLSLLKNEITFGLNRIYLLFSELGFSTTYYVAVNNLVIEQCINEINALHTQKFIKWDARDGIDFDENVVFLHKTKNKSLTFSTDPVQHVHIGATVTYVAMQLAFYMGFQDVILIGVDHSFSTVGDPHKTVVSTGDDTNHFSPNYFGKGFRWQLPDLETSEVAYKIAKQYFENAQRRVFDATVGGKLTVFPKVDYETLF